jgi:hypothetical protein
VREGGPKLEEATVMDAPVEPVPEVLVPMGLVRSPAVLTLRERICGGKFWLR